MAKIRVSYVEATRDAIYWVDSPPGVREQIVRSDKRGENRILVTDLDRVRRFAVDDDTLAVATPAGLLLQSLRDGARIELEPGQDVHDVLLVGDSVYFARSDACIEQPPTGSGLVSCQGKIFRVSKSGGAPELVVATPGDPQTMAVDSSCVYWTELEGLCQTTCSYHLRAAPR